MVHYKLVYFDTHGAAETARLIFAHAGVQFEDVRIPYAEWPNEHKDEPPFGQMPYLDVDGKKLAESNAINRYLARKFGLAGNDEWEQAWVDAIVDLLSDTILEIKPHLIALYGAGEDKDALREAIKTGVDKLLPQIEKLLKESGSGFLLKAGYTWVDFLYATRLAMLEKAVPGSVGKNDEVWAYQQRVHSIPKLQKYVASRK